MEVTLSRITVDPELAVEEAASVCYNSQPTLDYRIMRACYNSGHLSIFEHVNFTWVIKGVSRVLLAQLTRHRIASFSVQSQRYVSAKDMFEYVTPPRITALGPQYVARYKDQMETMHEWYGEWQTLLGGETEQSNEDARFVLPNAATTVIKVTMNAREFMHFCNERRCARAQWEIRKMADLMADTVLAKAPGFTGMFVPKCERNSKYPYCPEGKRKTCGRYPTLADIYPKKAEKPEFRI